MLWTLSPAQLLPGQWGLGAGEGWGTPFLAVALEHKTLHAGVLVSPFGEGKGPREDA